MFKRIGIILAGAVCAMGITAAVPAFACTPGDPTCQTVTVSGSAAEVLEWNGTLPSTVSLGALLPGTTSTSSAVGLSWYSNDVNGSAVYVAPDATSPSWTGQAANQDATQTTDNSNWSWRTQPDGGNIMPVTMADSWTGSKDQEQQEIGASAQAGTTTGDAFVSYSMGASLYPASFSEPFDLTLIAS